MASKTFTANGTKFKSTSKRRYAVVITIAAGTYTNETYGHTYTIESDQVEIIKRTDNPVTAGDSVREWMTDRRISEITMVDTTTGEIVSNLNRTGDRMGE